MRYHNIVEGTFLERPNRFIALVNLDGSTVRCHVKNTGRCKEILIRGTRVLLEKADEPSNRKTGYDLVAAYKGDLLINIDSQAPNAVALESLENILGPLNVVKPEYRIGDSRIDIYAESGDTHYLVEVKGVTLENHGIALFPDAKTSRGLKHVRELKESIDAGYTPIVLFIIQLKGMEHFEPNYDMDPEFGKALKDAQAKGVKILAYDCLVRKDSLILDETVPVKISSE